MTVDLTPVDYGRLSAGPVDDFVDDAVFLGLLRVHDEVPLDVALDAVEGLAGVLGHQGVGDLADAQNLARMNVDVRGLAAQTRPWTADE